MDKRQKPATGILEHLEVARCDHPSTVKRKLENEDSPRTLTEPFMNITTMKGWRKECGELAELGGRNREIECEQRAYARITGDLDAPLVRLHHRFDQAQSQSQSSLRAALIATVEAVPDLGRFFRRNPNAGIFNRDDGLLPLPESSLGDPPAPPRIFNFIVPSDCEPPLHPVAGRGPH